MALKTYLTLSVSSVGQRLTSVIQYKRCGGISYIIIIIPYMQWLQELTTSIIITSGVHVYDGHGPEGASNKAGKCLDT